ncbi:MAG: UDP-N-acetylglucosamine 2-epimerase [Actinomycetota bacterium]
MSKTSLEIGYSPAGIKKEGIESLLSRYRVDEPVHVVFIGTKPDIIKQYPVYKELTARGLQVVVCHSGQHTDFEYSEGMLLEFGMTVDVLFVMGDGLDLGARVAALITSANTLFSAASETGHTLIPYIHGDTATSMGVSVAAYMNRVACVHVEAGIRTMTPRREFLMRHLEAFEAGTFDWPSYLAGHRLEETYVLGSMEPFPEQFNTRVSDAGTGFHAAAVELNRRFLQDEGFPPDSIAVVGNTVVDATLAARERAAGSQILERFPQLKTGKFIRMCIHRRENTSDRARFTCYFDAIESLLRRGHSVLWVSLKGTEWALDNWGLAAKLESLELEFPETLIVTSVWPEYSDVIAAFLNCALLATDSGSIQEEANTLGIPCVTLRFGTDRGESLLAGGNVLAPPVSAEFVAEVIASAFTDRANLRAEPVYGTDCASRLVDEVLARAKVGSGLFRSEEEILRLPGTDSDWPTLLVPQSVM